MAKIMWNRKVCIRIFEVLLCIACVITLRVTDDESRRVFHYLRNRSREWSLLNNVTWGIIGAALATATCGGYLIITAGLLVAAVTGELNGRITELFLLGLGVILFGIVGSLSLASIESVPEDLIDNAAVFGALCLGTGLIFIVDLLMTTPGQKKKKHDGTQTFLDKETAASIKPSTVTTLSTENESRLPKPSTSENGVAKSSGSSGKKAGTANEVYDDSDELRHSRDIEDETPSSRELDHENRFSKIQRPRATEVRSEDRDRGYEPDDKQSREYAAQNFENGRTLRDSQRYRDPERDRREDEKIVRNSRRIDRDEGKIFYQGQDYRQRPADELDTPLFPSTRDSMPEPMFAKIVNPSVKIMRVERDAEDAFDTRYSDSSQYDNVPTRMSGNPEGILKRPRDVSFHVPASLRAYRAQAGPNKDDIEMLEEWINVLKTSTGNQTARSPSSPTDPGYVRHTASNWPRESKSKTPGSSPERANGR